MKKVLFTVALLLGACFASAQVSAVKKVNLKKLQKLLNRL